MLLLGLLPVLLSAACPALPSGVLGLPLLLLLGLLVVVANCFEYFATCFSSWYTSSSNVSVSCCCVGSVGSSSSSHVAAATGYGWDSLSTVSSLNLRLPW